MSPPAPGRGGTLLANTASLASPLHISPDCPRPVALRLLGRHGRPRVGSHLLCTSPLQIELAILRFPYDSWGTPFQQLKQVVEEPSPQLPADKFSEEFVDFTSQW